MALREILTEPNEILREKSLKVEKVDEDLQKLMDDMLETMYAAPGIGLAAIQIGVHKRVIVLDIGWRDKSESTNDEKQVERKNPMYFLNPEIITKSKNNSTYEEGCLSVPGQFAEYEDHPLERKYNSNAHANNSIDKHLCRYPLIPHPAALDEQKVTNTLIHYKYRQLVWQHGSNSPPSHD